MNHSPLSLKKYLAITLAVLVLFTTACSRKEYVEGVLGGVPVRIPSNKLDWPVSFNGDPGDFTSDPMPKVRSKIIRTFSITPPVGLHISTKDMYAIIVSSGESLRFFNFSHAYKIYDESDSDFERTEGVSYKKNGHIYGLEVYRAKAGDVYRTKSTELAMVYKHIVNGKTVSFIRCVDHENIKQRARGRYSCEQFFTLAPRFLAEVKVSYIEDHLPKWQQIEASIKREILSYADFKKERVE